MRLDRRYADLLFGAVLTCIMSGTISGIAAARGMGLDALSAAPGQWLHAWGNAFLLAWPAAFLVFKLVSPRVRRTVSWLCDVTDR